MNDIIAAFISYYKSRAFCRKFKVGSFEEDAVQSDMRHLSRRYDFGKTLTPRGQEVFRCLRKRFGDV